MRAITPVRAAVVKQEWASAVVAPAYDTMSADERTQYAATHPDSYLHVNRSADRGGGHPAQHRRLAAAGAEALERLRAMGVFTDADGPRLFAQRLVVRGLEQRAIIGSVTAESGLKFLAHERTYPARVQALVEHFRVTGVMSSPVMVTSVDGADEGRALLEKVDPTNELIDVELADGARLTVWSLADAHLPIRSDLYILDGHHRVAAAHGAGLDQVLVAWVHPEEVHVGSFDRLVDELAISPRRLLDALGTRFAVTEVADASAARPMQPGQVGLGLQGSWYRLDRRDGGSELDSEYVQRVVLEELLDCAGPTDPTIAYRPAGGSAPDAACTLLLAPVGLESITGAADRGEVMPPKSTYLAPKLRSGVMTVECRPGR